MKDRVNGTERASFANGAGIGPNYRILDAMYELNEITGEIPDRVRTIAENETTDKIRSFLEAKEIIDRAAGSVSVADNVSIENFTL